jgi:hypothetical protein
MAAKTNRRHRQQHRVGRRMGAGSWGAAVLMFGKRRLTQTQRRQIKCYEKPSLSGLMCVFYLFSVSFAAWCEQLPTAGLSIRRPPGTAFQPFRPHLKNIPQDPINSNYLSGKLSGHLFHIVPSPLGQRFPGHNLHGLLTKNRSPWKKLL